MKTCRWKFWSAVWVWAIILLLLFFVNDWLFHSWLLNSLIRCLPGVFFLICPIYPQKFEQFYTPEKSRLLIRIAAVGSIFLAFFIRSIPA